jgi:hypothetical protein
MTLPPKRYQDDKDPMFDSIRHNKWFATLETRREKLPQLRQAHTLITVEGLHMVEAAVLMDIDERELRDFYDFTDGRSRFGELDDRTKKLYQAILDASYDSYKYLGASVPFTKIVHRTASLFGVDGRPVVELWDIDPLVYPTSYKGIR